MQPSPAWGRLHPIGSNPACPSCSACSLFFALPASPLRQIRDRLALPRGRPAGQRTGTCAVMVTIMAVVVAGGEGRDQTRPWRPTSTSATPPTRGSPRARPGINTLAFPFRRKPGDPKYFTSRVTLDLRPSSANSGTKGNRLSAPGQVATGNGEDYGVLVGHVIYLDGGRWGGCSSAPAKHSQAGRLAGLGISESSQNPQLTSLTVGNAAHLVKINLRASQRERVRRP